MAIPGLLQDLPLFSWRGIEVPIVGRSASFTHEDVQHKFVFRDGELVEAQGARNWTFSYTIPFREDIVRAPYRNLFTRTLVEFVKACRDKSADALIDPVYGGFVAKCTSFRCELDVNKRDGVDVSVEYTQSPGLGEIDPLDRALEGLSPVEDATGIDAAVETIDWQQQEPPQATVDPLLALDGLGRQLEFTSNRISAQIENYAFRLERINDTIDALSDPNLWTFKRSLRRARHAAETLVTRGGSGGGPTIKTKQISQEQPVSAVAADVGMSTQAFLALNQSLAQQPSVPPGSTVRYLQRAG